MEGPEKQRRYDLEPRTEEFARRCRRWLKQLKKTHINIEDVRQLVRASGSVAANYIEANEALSKKDFLYRVKVSRKESKESRLFLRLLEVDEQVELEPERKALIQEATELLSIFSAIIRKME